MTEARCKNCGGAPSVHVGGVCPASAVQHFPGMPAPLTTTRMRTSAERKLQPIATGVLAYFPLAIAAVAEVSRRGNEKHNPGEPLHWAKEKSTDEADCCVRHITDSLREGPLALDDAGNPNLAAAAWRTLAWLERVLEGDERWRDPAGKPREGK